MPQLDLMHFFSQFFWFAIFFTVLFFYISFNILPHLVTNLKYRSKKLVSLSKKIGDSKKNVVSLRLFHDNSIFNAFDKTNKKISRSMILCNSSVDKNLSLLAINFHFNKDYFRFLAINSFKEFIFDKKVKNEL
jgi:hypothetical protein